MMINEFPTYDASENSTGCCPRFNPSGWDGQELHFANKLFVRATTRSLMHIPINMGAVFKKTFAAIEAGSARSDKDVIVLSRELSPWSAEHYFAVTHEVPDHEMCRLSGDYLTKVFEGPYKDAPRWMKEMEAFVESAGHRIEKMYFFYTTCPRCAKRYGKNYVVGVAQIH